MKDIDFERKKIVSQLTKGNISKSIVLISVPLIITNAFGIALELIDAVFVGRLGSDALAAVSMSGGVIFFFVTISFGIGIGTIALISAAFGEHDFERADKIAVQSLYLGVVISTVIGLAGFLFSHLVLGYLGAEGNILHVGTGYLKILFAGLFTMFFMFLGNAIFQGSGDTVTPMKIGALVVILNIILDPLLIFGLVGFPRLEAYGAAWATVISRTVGSFFMLFILIKGKGHITIKRKYAALDFGIIKKILLIGFPGAIQMFLRSFSMVVLIKITAIYGTVVVAAYGVGMRLFHLFLFPGFGFGGAASTMVGQNLGAKNPDRAYKSALLAALYYLLFLLLSATVIFIFAPEIAAFFNTEKKFIEISSVLFRYIAVGSIFLCSGVVFSRALQGAGESVWPMLMTALSLYGFQIPLAYILSNHFELKQNGIWIAIFIGTFVNGLLMAIIFFQGKWKLKKHSYEIIQNDKLI